MARDRRKLPGSTAEESDRALWERLTKGVKPLRGRPASPAPEPPAKPFTSSSEKKAAPQRPVVTRPKPALAPPPAPLEVGRTTGVDRRTAERFRRGQLPIDATLDLHGLRQDAAYARLTRFLDHALAQGLRVLLVVTGKGLGKAEGGVLRRALPLWLEDSGHRRSLLAIAPARPQHGGDGAFYLLLRRKRE